MKKIFVLFLALGSSLLLAADWPHFTNFKEGQAAAQKENKPMMIMIHTAGCPECKYMEEVVFTEEKTNAFLKEHFVSIALDFKTDEIPKKYIHFGVPHVYLTDEDGKVLDQQIGGTRGNRFLKKLEKTQAKIGG